MTVALVLLIGLFAILLLRMWQKLALLAEQIRSLRAHALEPIDYKPTGDVELADRLADATSEAEKLGLRMLGDYLEVTSANTANRPMRWFVDGEGTVFGWMAPFEVDRAKHVVVVLMSHQLDRQTVTARQPAASMLSLPAFVAFAQVPVATSLHNVLQKHRQRAGFDESDRAFVPVKTFDEVRHEVDRMREKVIAWRKEQPEDELLDQDLKALLGAQYGKLAGPMKRRLAQRR